MTERTETFDVLSQAWIPVRRADGTVSEMGIRDVLAHAHELDEITHNSVMVEYSLYRLLITFLMDALRPESTDDLEELLSRGEIDMQAVDDYVQACRKEGVTFDLFDAERPFLQAAYRAAFEKNKGPASALDYSLPRGNNHVHFVHPDGEQEISYPQAAQLLPTLQLFCTIGGRGYASGINGPPPYYMLIRGKNLFETLMFSLPAEASFHNMDFDDPPVLWRNTGDTASADPVLSTSVLGGMLFPARSVHLFPEDGRCRRVYFAPGLKFRSDAEAPTWTDPHVAYLNTKKGRFSWGPLHGRGVWRNIAQLADRKNMPAIVNTFTEMAEAGTFVHLQLYGVETDQASFLHSMRDDVRLPVSLTENRAAADAAVHMVDLAETTAYYLRQSLDVKTEASAPIIGQGLRDSCVQQFYDVCGEEYWGRLEQLALAEPGQLDELVLAWLDWTADQAKTARRELVGSVAMHERDIFALEEAANMFAARLGKLKKKEIESAEKKVNDDTQ